MECHGRRRPRAATHQTPKPPLDALSIEELEAYIEDLEGEILRVRAEIDKKDSHRKSVEGMFKT